MGTSPRSGRLAGVRTASATPPGLGRSLVVDTALRHVRVSAVREEPNVQLVSYPPRAKEMGAVGHDALWPAPVCEARRAGVIRANCSLIYGDVCSEREHPLREITQHVQEGLLRLGTLEYFRQTALTAMGTVRGTTRRVK